MKILPYMPELVGFQTMVIIDPYGMIFDAVGVFCPEFWLLFKSGSSYCGTRVVLYLLFVQIWFKRHHFSKNSFIRYNYVSSSVQSAILGLFTWYKYIKRTWKFFFFAYKKFLIVCFLRIFNMWFFPSQVFFWSFFFFLFLRG